MNCFNMSIAIARVGERLVTEITCVRFAARMDDDVLLDVCAGLAGVPAQLALPGPGPPASQGVHRFHSLHLAIAGLLFLCMYVKDMTQ